MKRAVCRKLNWIKLVLSSENFYDYIISHVKCIFSVEMADALIHSELKFIQYFCNNKCENEIREISVETKH